MMYFKEKQNLQEDKVYGQECKGVNYVSTKVEVQVLLLQLKRRRKQKWKEKQKIEVQTAERKDARQDVLEQNITRRRKGVGRRSLLRGSGGGIGFYNEYQD